MAYAILDVDIDEPFPFLRLSDEEVGVAVIVRRADRPIAFLMEELTPAATLSPDDLGDLVALRAEEDVLRFALIQELEADVASPSPIPLTVAICTRDRPHLLRPCLESLVAVRGAGSAPRCEILVVDNDPSDARTAEVIRTFPDIRYEVEPKQGLDFARNRAISATTTEFVAFIDDDVTVDRGWLEGLARAWARHPDAAAVTGQVLPYELVTVAQVEFERLSGFRRGFAASRFAGQVLDGDPSFPLRPGMFGSGCNMAFRRDVVRELGGFDEALDTGRPLPGGGDLDMFYRVIRAGHALVYEPSALVFHRHRRSHQELRHQYWTWGTGYMAFVHKTYRGDPEVRRRIRRMLVWWVWARLLELHNIVRGRSTASADLVLAHLAGGLVTLPWMYPLSCRRTERVRKRSR